MRLALSSQFRIRENVRHHKLRRHVRRAHGLLQKREVAEGPALEPPGGSRSCATAVTAAPQREGRSLLRPYHLPHLREHSLPYAVKPPHLHRID